ncbi:Pet127-domain-containing protein [Annulohypoxylon truncatum]|uniref:Pet127-domain-containing protein n=1 Tax=Annulohypoxylon truncatum TaxID=327061 RepID=UPI0020084D52|nr:Pet127-domain-containing protein [Annulohypoxylon truncatum]KAI1214997.1 Pet127-domain-containing protein [Annulohypoxylon truncatum]
MLQLSSRSARRIGTSYVCASCFAATQSARSRVLRPTLIPRYHGRLLSNTPLRAAQPVETPTTPADGASDIAVQSSNPSQKKKKKKGANKSSKKDQSQPDVQPLSKKAATQAADVRQLQVLQGALEALKNVLASQNINIDQIMKSNNQSDQATSASQPKAQAETKTKAKAKAKPKAKAKSKSTTTAATTGDEEVQDPKPIGAKARRKRSKARKQVAGDSATEAQDEQAKASKSDEKDHQESLPDTADDDINSLKFATPELQDKFQVVEDPSTDKTPPKSSKRKSKEQKSQKSQKAQKSQKSDKSQKAQKTQKPAKAPLAINVIRAKDLHMTPIQADRPPVPALSYGLERVLFNPGVYTLQDPRSRVYNFDPYLSEIMPIQEFDFNALKQYVTSSKDTNLIRIAKENAKKYTGSTSSMTSMLSHFHYLLSSWREINTSMLSRQFEPDSLQYTRIMRGPSAIFLNWRDGTYAIDADKEFDTANILSMLGKSMEKLLTLTKEEYERYRHINSDQITEEERNADEAFHYTGFRDFMMRSQLDAHDPRVPGSGMFDLKTRAVISIRMDAQGFHKGLGYEIRNRFGQWESFEREYYDMIRSAFLKYSLQVRMGRMDGIFVAFHNTQRIFGFQYIPLSEMDLALHGTSDTTLGDREYALSLSLLNDILDRATKKWPEQSLRIHFETRTSVDTPFMYIFAKPVSQADIDEVQSANRATIEAFERGILGLVKEEAEAESESIVEIDDAPKQEEEVEETSLAQAMSTLATWKEVRQVVENAVDDDEVGVGAVREAIEDALEQSGLLHAKSSAEARGYVDALLAAITSSMPPRPAVSSLEGSTREEIDVDEDDSSSSIQEPGQESETSNDEQLASSDEPDAKQARGHEESTEIEDADNQQQETTEQAEDVLVSQSESEVEQNEGQSTTTEPLESQIDSADEHGDNTALEQESVAEAHVEEQLDKSIEQVTEEPVETNQLLEEEAEEDEDDDETDDMDDELETAESKRDLNASTAMSPLRDLIVRIAQGIDERPIPSEPESSMDDSSKLKEFERILGELISRTKAEQARPQTDDVNQVTPESQTEPGVQIEAQSTESETEKVGETEDSTEQSSSEPASETSAPAEEEVDENLLGMVLTIKNKVNGQYVPRPENMSKGDSWSVEYNIEEIASKRASTLYNQCKTRRRKIFEDPGNKETEWFKMWRGKLDECTKAGRKFRAQELESAKTRPVHVVGHHEPLLWEDVFGRKNGKEEKPAEEDAETV